jgi:predicted Rossmann-fold nucleotide-binding protein
LDEFFEVVVEGQLHVHKKPIVLINQDNFYVPLIKLLDHIVAEGFAHGNINALYHLATDADEAMDIVSTALSAGEASAAEDILQD